MDQDQDQVAPMELNGEGQHHGGSIDLGAGSDGPPSILGVGPPSPLTGCYLLIIVGEPHSQDHKDIILQRLIKGFLSWDVVDCHVDLEDELHTITLQALEGEEGKHGERLIQYASENLVTEILIHPQVNTFIQCIRNLLSSFTRHRHIIHTGYTFSGNGSWILQDGTFSVVDFMEAFQEHEVQRVLRAYPDTITMDVHCAPAGQWHTIQDKSFSRLCQIRLNPVDVLDSGSEKLNAFVAYVSSMIIPTEISELLESSDVVGNIRFSHPTLYVFPGGQGDAALFGINGFNMLVDGGFSRKSCFWDFVRHLDRLDAVLMTRINNTNIKGISSVVERKSEAHVYPQIGHFFCNIPERKGLPSPDGDKDRDPLLVDLLEEGHQIVTNLKSLNLKAQSCYRESEPINLYHKVGHGTLDMYVISPARDSREVKDFLARWTAGDQRLFAKETKDGKDFAFPLQNLISICALLVWTPANPEDNITRILFPGSAPEYKILEGLEKMKNVEFMRQPVCPVKSISASLSTPVLVTKKSLKSASTDRILADPNHPSKPKDNKLIDNKMKMMQTDNKLAADAMDSSADEGKMEKQLTTKGPTATTVASAKVESKPKPIRKPGSAAMEKKIDNKKLEQQQQQQQLQQQDEKKDSISDVGSDKEEQTLAKPSMMATAAAADSEKSLDEGSMDVPERKTETDGAEIKPETDVKEKKKEPSPPAGADSGGVITGKSAKKPPVSRTTPASSATRSRVDTSGKTSTKASTERKPVERKKQPEVNKSSPTTPKKTPPAESKLANGSASKAEQADEVKRSVSKVAAPKAGAVTTGKAGKSSPKATPAKSAKDENNRKVLEARQRPSAAAAARREAISARKEAEKKAEASRAPQTERKPISRRPKGTGSVSSATTLGGSPVKAKKVLKSEKDAVIRKAKLDKNGTTDSSLVSTPSADEGGVAVPKRPIGAGTPEVTTGEGDTLEVTKHQQQQQQLAELKEEQEAVREIEAVFNRDTAAQKAQKHRELALTEEHREVQDSTTEPEEEEEYLIIEKEEQYTEDSINEPESSATKEEEIQKHQRDSQESEKRKRDSLVEEKGEDEMEKDELGETEADAQQIVNGTKSELEQPQQLDAGDEAHAPSEDERGEAEEREQHEKLSPKHKQELEDEVQEIIASAKEIAKSKMETSMDGLKTEEMSSISPDEKMSSTKKTSDTRDENEEPELQVAGHLKDHIDPPHHESHHEERVSATVESGATTTAPTLPEDERIPLDEIKEDLVIEEKHVREVTKEIELTAVASSAAAVVVEAGTEKASRAMPAEPEATAGAGATTTLPTVYEPLERPTPAKMQFSAQQAHMRDVVKTPDEVADLPVHEEADLEEGYGEDKDKDSKEDEEKDRDTKEKPEEEPIVVASTIMAPTMASKETDGKQPEKTDDDRQVADKAAESDKPCDTATKASELEGDFSRAVEEDIIATVESQQQMGVTPGAQGRLDYVDKLLQDLESQIVPVDAVEKKMEKAEKVKQQQLHAKDDQKTSEECDDEMKLPVEEELIVAQKVVPKVPLPPGDASASELDDIWKTPAKAEEKLDELKHLIDDKAKSTVSELVAIKDTVVKSVVERKEELVENVIELAAKQVDEDLKVTAGKLDAKVESCVDELSQMTSKADEALATIVTEASELEKMAKELKQDIVGQLDDTKQQLEQELTKEVEVVQEKAKGAISSFFGGITEGIKSGIEKMADKMEHKIKDKTEQVEEKLQQVTDKIDALKAEREQDSAETGPEVVTKPAEPALEQPFDRFGPYERSFTQELRETHITTVDSPVMDGDRLSMELKAMVNIPHDIHEDKELEELEDNKNLGTFVIEDIKYSAFEDANLREIKEEEDEDRVSPPQGMLEKLGPDTVGVMPPRARTPEDVAKIVANVAEVLKSDKDLEEIIPGFDPQELERKLSQGGAREEDVGTVQRMLVTASSEDGGEETVICEDGTITFSKSVTPEPMHGSGKSTPEIKVQEEDENEEDEEFDEKKRKEEEQTDKPMKEAAGEKKQSEADKSSPVSSGKSSPDLKTSPTSIEEKDKHELPEKVVQIDASKTAKFTPETSVTSGDIRKESLADQQHPVFGQIDDTRRESAISTFSERDYTKDESSFVDERDSSRAHSISSHISDLKEDAADLKSVADFLKESEKEQDQVFAEGELKMKELSSPESVTSQKTVSEKEPQLPAASGKLTQESAEASQTVSPTSGKDLSRDESAAAEETKAEATEFSRPESPASAGEASRPGSAMEDQKDEKIVDVTRHLKESASLDLAEEQAEHAMQFSRPDSPASTGEISRPSSAQHEATSSEKPADLKVGVKEDSRPASAASGSKPPSEKSLDMKADLKEESRPASAASETKTPSDKSIDMKADQKEESRPASAAPSEKSVELKADQKEESRPASAASDAKTPSDKPLDLKADQKEESRPASAVPSEKSIDLKNDQKEESRPASAVPSEKSVDFKADQKEESRPASATSEGKAPSEQSDDMKADKKEESRPASAVPSEKSVDLKPDQKEESRPASAASEKDGKALSEKSDDLKVDQKADSRPASAASDTKAPSEKSVDMIVDQKDVSRPASATSDAKDPSDKSVDLKGDQQEESRPASAAPSEKSVDLKADRKEESRPASAASDVKAPSVTSLDLKVDQKEESRPASAASEKDGKALSEKPEDIKVDQKEDSRPASAASDTKAPAEKSIDVKTDHKEDSRPTSATSDAYVPSEKSQDLKADQKEESRPASAVPSEKSVDLKADPKDVSRPASAASEAKAPSEKSIDLKADEKYESRPASAVPSEKAFDLKNDQKEESRPASAVPSEKSVDLKADQKEESRPASAASEAMAPSAKSVDLKADQKEESRPPSAVPSEKSFDLKPDQKEDSRPASAVPSETSVDQTKGDQKEESRPASAVPSEKAVDLKTDEKEESRPASAVPPEKSVDLKADQKEESRPASAVPSEKSVDLKADQKEESRPASAVPSEKSVDLKPDQKEDSRPVSAVPSEKSVDLKGDQKEESRPASAVPSEKDVDLKTDEKEESRPASVVLSEKSVDLKADQKEESRPASAVPSEKSVDLKADQKEESRPASAVPSEKSVDLKPDQKEDSRPASAVPSEKSVDLKGDQKQESRPASAVPPEKDVDLKTDEKEESRPASAVPSEKSVDLSADQKEESRPASAVPSEKSVDLKADQKEESRPASAVPSEKSVDLKADQKEESRPASAVPSEKTVDLKPDHKEDSRPASAVPSEKSDDLKGDQKEESRPTSAVPSEKDVDLKTDEKEESRPASAVPSEKSVDLKADQKEESRPPSAVPSEKSVDLKADQKEESRPASAVPSEKSVDLKADQKEESRPASAVPSEKSVDLKADQKEESRPASTEKSVDLKPDHKEDSRPASAVPSEKSVDLKGDQKEESRPASADSEKDGLRFSEKSVVQKDNQKAVPLSESAAAEETKAEATEFSRPESPASAGEASRPGSAMEDQKDEKIVDVTRHLKESASLDLAEEQAEHAMQFSRPDSPASTGEISRPSSAQHEATSSEKPADLKVGVKEDSRPASAASGSKPPSEKSLDMKADLKEESRPASAASETKTPSDKSIDMKADQKEESRPASAAPSEKSVELKADQKEESRPASAASDAKTPSDKPLDLKADQKEESRPASAVPSEKSIDLKNDQKEESRPASAVPSEKSVDFKADHKEESRPASATSDAKAPSDKSVDLKGDQQEESRPASAVPSEKSVDLKADRKEESRPASAASDVKAPSVTSLDLKVDQKEESRPASAASEKDGKALSEKPEDKIDLPQIASKEHSRPASAASDVDLSRPTSAASGTVDSKELVEKSVEKAHSRPESTASDKIPLEKCKEVPSTGSGTNQDVLEKTVSSPVGTSIELPADKSKQTDVISKDEKAVEKDSSRPDSAGTHVSESLVSDKVSEHSRPLSATSHASGKDEMVTSTTASCVEQQSATELSSRPESAASHQSATEQNVEPSSVIMQETSHTTQIYSGSASKEPSRPASAASDKSAANETRKDVNFAKFEESISRRESSSTPASKEERPTSVLSDGEEEEEDTQEKICLKETRSKSMSAVMSSNVQRVGFEGSTLGVLEESMVTSRDDLDMLRSPRDSVTKIEPSFTQKLGETTSTSVAAKSFKPLFDDAPQFPAAKKEEGQKDRETESTSMFPRCGLDSAESPEHGSSIAQGMDQLLKQTVNTMKEIEKMTSSVITSTVQATKEESSAEASKSVTATGLAFPVSCAADSGKSSPYLGDKSHESSAKSVSPQPDKDSLDESSTSLNTFIEKDSLSEGISKQLQKEQQKEQVSIRMSPVGESTAEPSVTVASQKASDELLFAGSKTPPTAPISPNVAVKEEGSHGAIITQSQTECSTLPGSTSAITMTASTAANTATVPKDDASGISTPKESVPSGKSSPGLMSVHTQGSTDSASKSINLGHSSSGIETSDSSPKPTSPFPKVVVVDTLKLADEAKTTSGMSTPDMTRSSTPDMVDSQIERIAPAATSGEKSDSQQTFTTTTTTTKTTTYIIKDGKKIEVDSNVHSDTVSEQTKASGDPAGGSIPAGSSVTTSSTTTTTYIIKDGQKVEGDSISTTKPSIPAQLTLAGTEQHGLAEDYDEKEVLSPRSDISSGQASRIVAAWHDEDVPGSPMSVTSQAPLSPSTKYTYDYDLQHSSSGVSKKSDIEIDQDSQDDIVPPQYGSDEARAAIPLGSSFKPDPMSTSFYGQLPEVTMPMATKTLASSTTRSVPIPIAGSGKELAKTYVEYASSGDSSVDSSHKQSFPSDSDRKYLDDADLDFEKTFSRGKMEDLMTTSMHFASEKEFMAATTTAAQAVLAQKLEMDFTSTGLPSSATTTTVVASAQPTITPTAPSQSQAQSQSTMQPQSTAPQSTQPSAAPSAPSGTASSEVKSVLDAWGKPLSLPSPAPMATEDNKTTPKKERRMLMSKTKLNNEKNLRKRAESPTKATAKKPASPVYVDLSYVPHHGNSYYANVEFFKRVRARYYVFSGTEPSREVYNALLEAKQTWEDKELEVTIIPTYDTDVLGYWVSENEELLAKYHIDLSPSAARCTINLQDHETSCSAYRLEF